MKRLLLSMVLMLLAAAASVAEDDAAPAKDEYASQDELEPQYEYDEIVVPAAAEDEPFADSVSTDAALAYLDRGATAWARGHQCITCHTSGSYVRMRPSLAKSCGPPLEELRKLCLDELQYFEEQRTEDRQWLTVNERPCRVAYTASGLAEWDAHVSGTTSEATRRAFDLLLELQREDGSWGNHTCWPPLESSDFQATTVAAMALATAPAWRETVDDPKTLAQLARTEQYLRETEPPHDYGKVLLLWASTRWPGLIDEQRQESIINQIFAMQQADGGWSIRRFAKPEQWGDGGRADRLRAEPDIDRPPSDGHMTGLVVLTLIDAGLPATDARIARGVDWLLSNQRVSGRWWTRSLNTDNAHYITFSSTLYALVALEKTGALPQK